LSRDK